MSNQQILGRCLCGKAEFTVADDFQKFELSHCKASQRLSGSSYQSQLYIEASKFRWIKGSGFVKRYRHREHHFSKAYCMECGSSMPLESLDGKSVCIPAGALDQQPSITPEHRHWEERMTWLDDIFPVTQTNTST